ncbi:hypothetical protein FBQ97_15325, partial [Acidobacteria bacterium ACD]|nr:hypothetical protein [Acidobacteria bacterium ACD]
MGRAGSDLDRDRPAAHPPRRVEGGGHLPPVRGLRRVAGRRAPEGLPRRGDRVRRGRWLGPRHHGPHRRPGRPGLLRPRGLDVREGTGDRRNGHRRQRLLRRDRGHLLVPLGAPRRHRGRRGPGDRRGAHGPLPAAPRRLGAAGTGGAPVSAVRSPARKLLAPGATLALVLGIWFAPVPQGLTAPAWHLFALFLGSIVAVVSGALPILTSAVLALGAAVLTRTLTPAGAYAGFANGTILLIIVAFLVARAVVKCGLGQRLGYLVVTLFGRSTLGLGYSVFLLDAVIAPAFPSNTARGGVLYPIVLSLARSSGSQPDEATRKRTGAYLMFCG